MPGYKSSPEYKSSLVRSGNMNFFDYWSSLVTRVIHVSLLPRIQVLPGYKSSPHYKCCLDTRVARLQVAWLAPAARVAWLLESPGLLE